MPLLRRFLDELKRRRVFRVAVAYAVVAWLVIQVANDTFPALALPEWTVTLVVACAALGFPVAIVLAWAFDVTAEGVRRTPSTDPGSASGPPGRRPRPRTLAVAGTGVAVVVLLATAALLAGRRSPPAVAQGDATAAAAAPGIAVLAFEDLSAAGDQEYFAHGLAEELLNVLAQMEGLRVAARTSSFAFAGKDVAITEIGRQLAVEHVLEGSVRDANGRIRVTAQLIDARTGYHVWSETYERDVADVLTIQDEVSAAITNALELRLLGDGAASARRTRARNPEALRLYLRGRHAWNQRTGESLREARGYFERAVAADPTFALAYAGLADAYMLLEDWGAVPREEAFSQGPAAARRALELDETLAEAHTSLAHILMHQLDFQESEREYLRALELNPNQATAHQWYSLLLSMQKRWDEALAHARRAAALDPLSMTTDRAPGLVLYLADRPEPAIAELEAALTRHPEHPGILDWLHKAYRQAGRFEHCRAIVQARVDRNPGRAAPRVELAATLAAAGQHDDARRLLEQVRADPDAAAVSAHQFVAAYAYLGQLDSAFVWLDRSAEAREPLLDFVQVYPEFERLRGDPRFQRILRKTGHIR